MKTFSAPFLLLDSIKFQGAPQGVYVRNGVIAAKTDANGTAFGSVQGAMRERGAMQARANAKSLIRKVLAEGGGIEAAVIEQQGRSCMRWGVDAVSGKGF